jgi:hypothetical protein
MGVGLGSIFKKRLIPSHLPQMDGQKDQPAARATKDLQKGDETPSPDSLGSRQSRAWGGSKIQFIKLETSAKIADLKSR